MEKVKDFIKRHVGIFSLLLIIIGCYFTIFHNIWSYPLLDLDETRYVSMSKEMIKTKNFLTLYLNGEYFFEKPPLFFWLEALCFSLFNNINEFLARLPSAILYTLSVLSVYFIGRYIKSSIFGIVSAFILLTSVEFVILGKMAILDIVLSAFVTFSILCGFMALLDKQEKNKKYFWYGFYIFSALAVLAKGIPGFVLPFLTIFICLTISKQLRTSLKPKYFVVGSLIFLIIILPWHIIMFIKHNPEFFQEYIIKHHLARFLGSKDLGREQPWYFFLLTIMWGFLPWSLSLFSVLLKKLNNIKYVFQKNILKFEYEKYNCFEKFLIFNTIATIVIFVFFSSSSTKLITYILPIYPFLSFLAAKIWLDFIEKNEYSKTINITSLILNILLFFIGIIAYFSRFFLYDSIYNQIILPIEYVIPIVIAFCAFNIINIIKKKRLLLFITTVLLIIILSSVAIRKIYEIDYSFGQNDLIKFAKYAKMNNKRLSTFGFGRRFSVLYYYDKNLTFKTEKDYNWLDSKLKSKNNVIIIRNKNANQIKKAIKTDFKVIEKGVKYQLIQKKE